MEHQRKLFQQRGYSEDLLPKTQSQRTWKTFNYFTLWMGSVHNVPNYVMVGGFFILGLSTFSIMLAIILSAFFIAAVMVLNGAAGSKYGVPFAMILRASYGVRGALFPGLLRGGIAAIMWFGLQCYAGSLACLILIGKIWPGFLTLGGDFTLLGLSLPGLITFLLFWLVNVGIGFGGGKVLNKFTVDSICQCNTTQHNGAIWPRCVVWRTFYSEKCRGGFFVRINGYGLGGRFILCEYLVPDRCRQDHNFTHADRLPAPHFRDRHDCGIRHR